MEAALPDFKKEWLMLGGEKPTFTEPVRVSRPPGLVGDTAKELESGGVYVSLRGKPQGKPRIRVMDIGNGNGTDPDRPELQTYDVEMKIEAGETVFTVWHIGDDLKALQELCHAMVNADDVEVSGKMEWTGSEFGILVDGWGPVGEG